MTFGDALTFVAALPAVYGVVCFVRRIFHAQRTARWAKTTYPDEWKSLHWLAQRHAQAAVDLLIRKGVITDPEASAFRARDQDLEKRTWLGLLASFVLLFVVALLR